MPKQVVESIFIRQITPGDFWHIERGPATDAGGGSQTYIDIPLGEGNSLLGPLWSFLDVQPPARSTDRWPSGRIPVRVLGDPAAPPFELSFDPRQGNNRYKISNQARQKPGSRRHPAWTAANGFPRAPNNVRSRAETDRVDVSHLKIYVVKTTDGEYFAGFVNRADMPDDWPKGMGLESLFDPRVSSKMVTFDDPPADVPTLVRRILKAWETKHNVLLYGPPGTGKTHAMNYLWRLLESATGAERGLELDASNKDTPFRAIEGELPFETPIRRDWVTFHQNFSYENFVIALRPEATESGLTLKPRMGVLLDAATSLDAEIEQPEELKFSTAVIYIDEINRGNVSRIFGEFITFMDPDYRADGNGVPLPVPLTSVRSEGEETEPIERVVGGEVSLPIPWYFPQNVYVLASMNSVDRAVAPLDSALARRFARIEVAPDMEFLAQHLGIGDAAALLKSAAIGSEDAEADAEEEGEVEALEEEVVAAGGAQGEGESSAASPAEEGAAEVAWLLLYRLNYDIASTLGTDFELGHAYVMGVADGDDEDEKFRILARAWDQAIYPQLQERYINRPDELQRILRLDKRHAPPSQYLFSKRQAPRGATTPPSGARYIPHVPTLEDAPIGQVRVTLRYLAGL
jgi:DNA polymerase III delta prime subunit